MWVRFGQSVIVILAFAGFRSVVSNAGTIQGHLPRIGIISDQKARTQADLLMIELQKLDCELVERDEINKVLREQAMSLADPTGKEALRVGNLIKADGLVLLTMPTNDVSFVRLVAVAPGVIVWFDEFSSQGNKKAGVESWEKTAASVLVGYLPKLAVKQDDAIPLSLQGVQPAVSTVQAAKVARDFNRLLQLRLVREPSLFVLERENLMQMEEEHRWSGRVSEFWSAGYVLDGAVSHDLTETNQVILRLTLASASTDNKNPGAKKQLVETGRIDELPKLVEQIAAKVFAHCGAHILQKKWDPLKEAQAFVDLAKRQVNLDRYVVEKSDLKRAKTSLETAMALGLNNYKVGSFYRAVLSRQVNDNLESVFSHVIPLDRCSLEELRERASLVLQMLEFSSSYGKGEFSHEDEQRWLDGAVMQQGSSFDLAARFLMGVHLVHREKDLGSLLEQIQLEARTLGSRLWFKDDHRAFARGRYYTLGEVANFYDTADDILRVFRWSCYLSETGAEYCGIYPPGTTLGREGIDPVFPSARTEPKETRNAMWDAFMKTITPSPSTPAQRLEECMHRCAQIAPDRGTRDAWRKAFQDQLWENRESLFSGRTDPWLIFAAAYSNVGPFGGRQKMNERGSAIRIFNYLCDDATISDKDIVEKCAPVLAGLSWMKDFIEQYYFAEGVYSSIKSREQRHTGKDEDKVGLASLRQQFEKVNPHLAVSKSKLSVSRWIEMPCKGVASMGLSIPPCWKDKKEYFYYYGCILELDPQIQKINKIGDFDLPVQNLPYGSIQLSDGDFRGAKKIFLIVTDNFYIFGLNHTSIKYDGGFLSLQRRGNGRCHSASTDAQIGNLVEVNGVVYAVIARSTNISKEWILGIVAVDPETLKFTTLLDPMTLVNDGLPESDLRMFKQIASTGKELLVECGSGRKKSYYAWSPDVKIWRPVDRTLWESAQPDVNPCRTASLPFGFEVVFSGPTPLSIRHLISQETIGIPLECKQDPVSGPILTGASVLFHCNAPGYLEIPYSDIQQWLAVNVPSSASTNAPVAPASSTANRQ